MPCCGDTKRTHISRIFVFASVAGHSRWSTVVGGGREEQQGEENLEYLSNLAERLAEDWNPGQQLQHGDGNGPSLLVQLLRAQVRYEWSVCLACFGRWCVCNM